MACSDLKKTKHTQTHFNEGVTQHGQMDGWFSIHSFILWTCLIPISGTILESEFAKPSPNCTTGSKALHLIWCVAKKAWTSRTRPPITCIFALDRPRRVAVAPSQAGARRRRSIWHSRRLPVGLHGGVQRSLAVVRKRRQAVVWEAVPQRVGQLEPTEPVRHPVPPGLERSRGEDWWVYFLSVLKTQIRKFPHLEASLFVRRHRDVAEGLPALGTGQCGSAPVLRLVILHLHAHRSQQTHQLSVWRGQREESRSGIGQEQLIRIHYNIPHSCD